MGQEPRRHDRHDPQEEETARQEAHRANRDELGDEAFEPIPEGSGKQFGRGVGNEHVGERLVPGEPSQELHGERVPEGSGKQFARGVGDDLSEEKRREREEP